MANRKKTVADYDAAIKALQEKRRAAQIAEKKRIAQETKANEQKRNSKLYAVMKGFLESKNITDSQLIELPTAELAKMIFDNPNKQ